MSSKVREALAARPDRVRHGVEVALALALSVQLGHVGWILFRPSPAPAAVGPVASTPSDPAVFERFDAFFRTGGVSSLAEATSAGSAQMRLFGLRSDGAGDGSAIIGLPDGRQVSVAVGGQVEPGLVLQSVGPDHVILMRGGSVTRLIFSETPVGAAPVPPPPPGPQTVRPDPEPATPAVAPASGPAIDPARLMAQASLRPRMRGMRIDGFTVSGSGDGSVLRAAGLRPGDVILAVNGQPLDNLDRITALRGDLANSSSAEFRYERDGAVHTSTVRTGR